MAGGLLAKPARYRLGAIVLPLALAGCATYQVPPLGTNHPANTDASAAPARPPSQTLVYTAADVPSVQPVTSVAAAPPEAHRQGAGEATSPSPTVVGQGEVVSTIPSSSQIVLDHEEIKGFMEAMTMGYRVDPPSLLAGLSEGDKVRFTIDVGRRAIVRIEKLK